MKTFSKPIIACTTALALSLPSALWAQSGTSGSGVDQDQSMAQKIKQADAPDTAETDPVNETAGMAENARQAQNAKSRAAMGGQSGRTLVLDIEAFGHDIYERGYRQGYIRGAREAREDIAMQLAYGAKRQQLMNSRENWETTEGDQAKAGAERPQSGQERVQQTSASQGDAVQPKDERLSNEIAARPGGSIVILPAGMSPEAFIEQIVSQNVQTSSTQTVSDGSDKN